MKKHLTLLVAFLPFFAIAHEHIEVGLDPGNPARLTMVGGTSHLATYFPLHEVPSFNLSNFPGSYFASELTFSAEGDVLDVPSPSFMQVEVLAVSGPSGAEFAFWDNNLNVPTWMVGTGWMASGDPLTFNVSDDETGFGHIHGRAFTMDRPGIYEVTLRAIDTSAAGYTASAPFVVRFTAIEAPRLGIAKVNQNIKLTFASRPDLIYDVQSSTTLAADDWTTIDTLDGTGGAVEFVDPIAGRPRVFYRLVEYQ